MTNNEELPLCECGCGNPVEKKGNMFIFGHQRRNKYYHERQIRKLCGCGCKEYALPGNDYIYGHQNKGKRKKLSDEHKLKLSEKALKEKEPLPDNWKIDKNGKMAKNKNSPQYLGIFIAEQVLSKIFKHIQRMPYSNPGYDVICDNGYKIDIKSSTEGKSGGGSWYFNIKKNTIPDYFLLISFDNRDNLTPLYLWLIPGNVLNNNQSVQISRLTLYMWDKYEQPIDKVIACCNGMRGE